MDNYTIGKVELKYKEWLETALENGLLEISVTNGSDLSCSREEYFAELNEWNRQIDNPNKKPRLMVVC